MFKKTLLIAGTHGDEPIGLALIKRLAGQKNITSEYETVIANPRAVKERKRYIEIDLNRIAPGEINSSVYEIARAAELVEYAKKFDCVLDFHETKANDKIVVIIPELTRKSLALALSLEIKEILIWPSVSSTGPLVKYIPFGVEIECGTKNNFKENLDKLEEIILNFFKKGISMVQKNLSTPAGKITDRKFYMVYDKINSSEYEGVELNDFEEVKIENEKFIPLLFGKHKNLKGYKMRKVDKNELLDIIQQEPEPSEKEGGLEN